MKPTRLADEQLVACYQQTSDEDCFEMLYQRYVGKVYQKCLTMTKDADLAEDYTQDIFIKVFNKIDSFQERSKFSTWLYSISHHYCLDQIRVGKRMVHESWSDTLQDQLPDDNEENIMAVRLSDLGKLLEGIPVEEVSFLQLKYEQNMSIRDIAKLHKLSESAVKMRLKRTRDRLYERHKAYQSKDW
ncbi:RNA polymerase sigma factor [Spirosoma sp. KUDC1026]|uniref:RNA polymerase sigma factor n=1 Tax=Spirosoma sp. KUDC1026 TaxID=2745947 RepID=UPI001E475C73|nr:RNA polymerase sigma factor [Spirosoma sp. KUDC1026]